MYEAFYGFSERPFQLTPNPRYLFLNASHREALATLRYGLTSSLGITLVLGEAGTGKTTLLRAALRAESRPEYRFALISNPTLTAPEFFEILAESYGLRHTGGSKGRFLLDFERDLVERQRAGRLTALVVDEAQSLTHGLFEEIRLLANLETETTKLLNVVLVGQPELADRLNDVSLRQFKQRVVLRSALAPLDLDSTGGYIALRLWVAGASAANIFTRDAVAAIYHASRGIPRTISVVCENALLAGYAAQQRPVDREIVVQVCRDLDLPVDGGPPFRDLPPSNGRPPREPAPSPYQERAAARREMAASQGAVAGAAPARQQEQVVPGEHAVAATNYEPAGNGDGAGAPPPAEPPSRRRPSRSWFASREKEAAPEPAGEREPTGDRDRARDDDASTTRGRRIFRFF